MRIFIGIVLIILAAALQLTEIVSFFGVKPNLVLVLLIIYAFFINELWVYAMLVLIGDIMILFSPGTSKEIFLLSIVALAVYFIKKKFLDSSLLSCLLLVFFGSFLFSLLIFPNMIISKIFIIEVVYNLVLGAIVYEVYDLLTKSHDKKTFFRI